MEEDMTTIGRVFMETDFIDRTVIKIITDKGYEPLLRDFKVA